MGVRILCFLSSCSGRHPEATQAAVGNSPDMQSTLLVSSPPPSSAMLLISRDRGGCRTGARHRSSLAGWGRRQDCACVQVCGWISGCACVLTCMHLVTLEHVRVSDSWRHTDFKIESLLQSVSKQPTNITNSYAMCFPSDVHSWEFMFNYTWQIYIPTHVYTTNLYH